MFNFSNGSDIANIYKLSNGDRPPKFVTALKIERPNFDTHSIDDVKNIINGSNNNRHIRVRSSHKDPNLKVIDNVFGCPDGYDMRLSPVHDKDQNIRMVVIGPSGSGKSTWVKNYILDYKKKYPKKECFLFSRHDEDPSIDDANPTRVIVTEAEIANAMAKKKALLENKDLAESLVIFDDTYSSTSKLLVDFWNRLATDLAQNGRKLGIDLIFIIHNTNYAQTRFLMSEATHYVLFLKSGANAMYMRILKEYLGYKDPKTITRLFELPTRYCVFANTAPLYILTQNMCFDQSFLN
jgi:hypothetical protein